MDPLLDSARALAREVNARAASAAEIAEAVIPHVERADAQLAAYLELTPELMRAQARRVDQRVAAGEQLPLAGVPVALKDNMCLTGTRTTAGSKILESFLSPYTATAVQRLLDAGALPIGKTNLDEFAMGSSGENSAFAPAARRRSAASRRRSRSAATPGARSASRPRSATWWDSSRRTGASRDTV
jgi:aspartyl-tRNA(Asn)/glutamyl-tRNA(Gln) amidotransferase subunit A